MSKGSGRKCCINCSADLTSTATENKSAFYSLTYSSRVRSPFSPATVELVPIHHALATVFNFEALGKVSKGSVSGTVSDNGNMDFGEMEIEDNLQKENSFKEFQSSASTIPMCYVCYLVLSDLYRNYTEFTQLRKPDSFLGSKLKELENQRMTIIAYQSQQTQESSSISNPNDPNQLLHSIERFNIHRPNTLKNLDVNETPSASNLRVSVKSEFITAADRDRNVDADDNADLNLMLGPTELGTPNVASGNRHLKGKRLYRSTDFDDDVAVGTVTPPFQKEIVVYESISKKTKFSFSEGQTKSSQIAPKKQTGIIQNAMKTANSMQMLWKSFACEGFKRYCHAAVAVDDTIYSFGGIGDSTSWRDSMDILVLKTSDSPLKWKVLSVETNAFTPLQRHLHTVAVIASGNLIYLWGGFSFPQRNNQLHVFNTKTFKWEKYEVSGEIPASRWSHTATVVRNKMYVFGGWDFTEGCTSSTIKCLDLSTLFWSTISPKNPYPTPRAQHTAVTYGSKIFVFGGCEGKLKNVYSNSLLCFNVETNEWSFPEVTGTIPEPRKDHCASSHMGFMYIFGGMGNQGALNDLYRYDFERSNWQKLTPKGQSPNPRTGSKSVVIKDELFILGGMNMNKTDDFCDDSFVVTIVKYFQRRIEDPAMVLRNNHINNSVD